MSLLLCISSQPWAREGHEWPSPGRLEHFQCFNLDTGSVSHQVKNSLYFLTLSALYLLLSSAASRNGVLLMPPATKMHHLLTLHTSYMKLGTQQHSRSEGRASWTSRLQGEHPMIRPPGLLRCSCDFHRGFILSQL